MVHMYHLWINILDNHIFKCRKSKLFLKNLFIKNFRCIFNRLLGQGFSFNRDNQPVKTESVLPPSGRRIHVSSRIMSEILGTLYFLKYEKKTLALKTICYFFLSDLIQQIMKQMIVCVY